MEPHMTDAIDKLSAMKERIEQLMKEEEFRAGKLETEIAGMDQAIALASALAALKAASTDCKHSRVRAQIQGAREQIQRVLGSAA
jgi:hypothetical protein